MRLGLQHVVMDPGVRLAYELEQVDRFRGPPAAAAAAAAAAAGGRESSGVDAGVGPAMSASAAGGLPGLGPWLPWAKVANTSAALKRRHAAAVSAVPAAATLGGGGNHHQQQQQQQHGALWMECCDLLPNQSYVDFRNSCHMVDVYKTNYTAKVLAGSGARSNRSIG
jgi:hypothetical protein